VESGLVEPPAAVVVVELPERVATYGLAQEALRDVHDDLDELLFLIRSASAQLAQLQEELDASALRLHRGSAALLRSQVQLLVSRYGELGRRVLGLRQQASVADLDALDAERAACAELVRTQQLVVASLATACDWQSPPFLVSSPIGSGGEYGRITPHWNDYKRDRHLDAEEYEAAFVAEFVDMPGEWRALATSCGMAALTTIVGFLKSGAARAGPVLAGAGLYHETKIVLEHAFGDRVLYADERELPAAVHRFRPSIVFLDSLCNTRAALVPDVDAVAAELGDGMLVVDNTGVPCGQPFGNRTIVFESLLKYHQLGLDRVNAGIIVAPIEHAPRLSACREHLGTNVTDVAVRTLPRPRRDVLERRLARIGRNALLIAERLETELGDGVAHPGLASHPSFPVAERLRFRGGCVSLALDDCGLVDDVVAEARRRSVPLVGGSSFGFDTTRIYLTAARAAQGEPFVRIAVGTEHRLAIEGVAEAIAAAIRRSRGVGTFSGPRGVSRV
jgi:cystathionine beta-lyase/cystathionine gamma-synthase